MADEQKEKESIENADISHMDFAGNDGHADPTSQQRDGMAPISHEMTRMTTHGDRELMPQPSKDPRDPLVCCGLLRLEIGFRWAY